MQATREIRIVAQDPSVKGSGGTILTTLVRVPYEELDEGPRGYRVSVIDYDASTDLLYRPWQPQNERALRQTLSDEEVLKAPDFHAQHVYALVMRTIGRFEQALGRRVGWAFSGQQLKVAPHAFRAANAFYSREHQALLFGYFPSSEAPGTWIYSSLSHDVVVHETTHAILDGLRERFIEASHPDQAAFHEGFADVVALLSVYSLQDVVRETLLRERIVDTATLLVERESLTLATMQKSALMGLAKQMGAEISGGRVNVLRRSAVLDPAELDSSANEFEESHRRGEIFAAAMLNTFLAAWLHRLSQMGDRRGPLHVSQVAEEAAAAADELLGIAIRALDYTPPVDLRFEDYLSAMLTSDAELRPDDSRYEFRDFLRRIFGKYRVQPAEGSCDDGRWMSVRNTQLIYDRTHIESIQRSPEEVFRFLWENRAELGIRADAYTHVTSVRPSLRVVEDGFVVRETVADYSQKLDIVARDLSRYQVARPPGMPDDMHLRLTGGGVLIFDEYGRLKYHVYQRLFGRRQSERLEKLWTLGVLPSAPPSPSGKLSPFAIWHQERLAGHTFQRRW